MENGQSWLLIDQTVCVQNSLGKEDGSWRNWRVVQLATDDGAEYVKGVRVSWVKSSKIWGHL